MPLIPSHKGRCCHSNVMLAMTSCERPDGARYLPGTLAAINREGAYIARPKILVVDGSFRKIWREEAWNSSFLPHDWICIEHGGERRGNRWAMWQIFRMFMAEGVGKLLYCEDDIVPCRNALLRAARIEVPDDVAFIDFHDMKELPGKPPGYHRVPAMGHDGVGYWGNQLMLFPRRTVEWLLSRNVRGIIGGPNAADYALGRLLVDSPWPMYLAHLPCLVRHMGAVSVAHPDHELLPGRLPTSYPGDDFDALSLSW